MIEVSDDGRGLDRQRIVRKAEEAGIAQPLQSLSDEEAWRLIFHPGLTTALEVTDVSGRGVGMDVVKRNVEALRGRIEIRSSPSVGTTFRVRLPLTLAVIDALTIGVGDERYLIPISSIEECFLPQPEQILDAPGVGMICMVRGRPLPMVQLRELFCHGAARAVAAEPNPACNPSPAPVVVVVRDGPRRCCLGVDVLFGQQQVVLKPLGVAVGATPGISGGSVLGDGRISLVLDVPGLVHLAGVRRLAVAHSAPQGANQ